MKNIFQSLNKFAIPLVANSFFNILISSIMGAIVGRISVSAIASTSVVDTYMYVIIGIVGSGVVSFSIYASKVHNNKLEYNDYFKSILYINLFIGILCFIVFFFLSNYILKYIFFFNGEVLTIGTYYSKIISVECFLTLLNFCFTNRMKLMRSTKQLLYIGIFSAIINLFLTYILVFYCFHGEYKIIGVGIAKIIAITIMTIYYIYFLKKDLIELFSIKASKVKFLIVKSLPLILQEILEGSIFSMGITIFILSIGIFEFSSYTVVFKMVTISFAPLYVYCNALLIFISESFEDKNLYRLKSIPIVTLFITLTIYIIFSVFFILNSKFMIKLFTDKTDLIIRGLEILPIVFLFSGFQIFFEVSKYSLQAIGEEIKVLKTTGIVNLIFILALFIIKYFESLNLFVILLGLAINYLVLYLIFTYIYKNKLTLKTDLF